MASRVRGREDTSIFSLIFETVRRAFAEFLFIPTCLIAGFFLLAAGTYFLDTSQIGNAGPLRKFLQSHIFSNSDATSSLLAAIAAGIITMTSITISLLLIAVQQSAGSLTGQVYDQFLRRKTNQIYFGFFIGLALYSLITLATVSERFNPVFGATIAFVATTVSLYLLILLLYTTINQMRPIEIIEAIHEHILAAGERQRRFLGRTRRETVFSGAMRFPVRTEKHGYVTRIYLDQIAKAAGSDGEVVMLVPIGAYVAFGDEIAIATANTSEAAAKLAAAAKAAFTIERQRDIALDPAFGIQQVEMIAWTSISTSKSNPAPGLIAIQCLRDVMARWSEVEVEERAAEETVPVVYSTDTFDKLFSTLETFAVVSSESMQHQIYIEVLRTFTLMFDRLSDERRDRAEDLILRILSALGDHVLTYDLDNALAEMATKLMNSGRTVAADAVRQARKQMLGSVGKLGSRSTRVQGGN